MRKNHLREAKSVGGAFAGVRGKGRLSGLGFALLYLTGFALAISLLLYWQRSYFFPPETETALRITVILAEDRGYTTNILREGMSQAAFDHNCELTFVAPLQRSSSVEQTELLVKEASDPPLGIILVPADLEKLAAKVQELDLRFPVLYVNAPANAHATVGPDYTALARALAQRVLQEHPDVEHFDLFYSDGKNSAVKAVESELKIALKASSPKSVSSHALTEDFNASYYASLLKAQESSVLIALDASSLEKLGQSLDLYPQDSAVPALYGRGATPRNVDYLKREIVDCLIAESDYNAGYLAVANLAASIRSKKAPANILLEFHVLDRANINNPDFELLLYPLIQ